MFSKLGTTIYSLILGSLFLLGCSDTNPTVSLLRAIDGFEFSTPSVVTSSLSSVRLQATCSAFVSTVEMSFDDGSTWIAASAYDPAGDSGCEDGTFSVTLSNAKAPLSAMSFTSGQELVVKFRALPRVGEWIYRNVTVKYTPVSTIKQEMLAGSQVQTSGTVILKGRVRGMQQHTAQGGSFSLTGRVVQ